MSIFSVRPYISKSNFELILSPLFELESKRLILLTVTVCFWTIGDSIISVINSFNESKLKALKLISNPLSLNE